MVKVFNTMSGAVEEFRPLTEGRVLMYGCGPTVYDHSHIGHGRANLTYDTVVRYLRHRGFQVKFVRNITDVDDKIIKKANAEGVKFEEVARTYAASFWEDMKALRILPPDLEPKASETIPEIIEMTRALISSGKAYASGSDVYFSIATNMKYGALSRKQIDELHAGARVEPGELKRAPLDFALWKGAKPGEPSWASPWGEGRPGWHIECSAMIRKHLGDSIDIHAGGRDLIFPHHENEIAQSEGVTGKPFCKYWVHNGFVNFGNEKMSKSLGNVVSLKGLLERFHPEAIRFYLMACHYRSPIDFSDVSIEESARGLDRIYRVLLSIPSDASKEAPADRVRRFEEAMDDDFNTAQALAVIFDAVKDANRLQAKPETLGNACALRTFIVQSAGILGLLCEDPAAYFRSLPGRNDTDVVRVEELIAKRQEARRQKNFSEADRIRGELAALNVVVEDSPEGTTWRRKT